MSTVRYGTVLLHKKSLRKCFVAASQLQDEDGRFRPYTDPKAGLLDMKLDGKGSVDGDGRIPKFPRGCLADTLSAVEFVPNPDQREPGDWSSDSSDDSGSDDEAE